MFFVNLLETNLQTKLIGKQIEYYAFTDSTNDDIWELTEDEPINGIVVVTDNQKNGRGQRDKKWFSKAGHSITCSFMITGTDEYSRLLSVLIPVGINNGIKNLLNLDTDIKWPNDIYFQNKKLGGILIESKMNSGTNNYAIGIGLNVNETEVDFPEELNENAISIKTILGKSVQRELLLSYILNSIDKLMQEKNLNGLVKEYNSKCISINQTVYINSNSKKQSGIFMGINDRGQALIKTKDGENWNWHAIGQGIDL